MKHKVSELEGALLDAAVKKAVGRPPDFVRSFFHPSVDWADAGPIIEMERIWLSDTVDDAGRRWIASMPPHCDVHTGVDLIQEGPTPLVAAMRAFVMAKLGEEVEL